MDIAIFTVNDDTKAARTLAHLGGAANEELPDLTMTAGGEIALVVRYEGTTSIGDYAETSNDRDGLIAWLVPE